MAFKIAVCIAVLLLGLLTLALTEELRTLNLRMKQMERHVKMLNDEILTDKRLIMALDENLDNFKVSYSREAARINNSVTPRIKNLEAKAVEHEQKITKLNGWPSTESKD